MISIVIGDEEKATRRLAELLKKFDELSPFAKELMFSYLVALSGIFEDEKNYFEVKEELEKLKGYGL
jgi:uncharacterized protein YutD